MKQKRLLSLFTVAFFLISMFSSGVSTVSGSEFTGTHLFTFNNGTEGFTIGWNTLSSLTSENGKLVGVCNAASINLFTPGGISIDTNQYKAIRIRMNNQTSATNLQLYWDGTGGTYGASGQPALVSGLAANSQAGVYTDYFIDLRTNAGWTGTVNQIRFDLSTTVVGETFRIDEIEFMPYVQDAHIFTFNNSTEQFGNIYDPGIISAVDGKLVINKPSGNANVYSPMMNVEANKISYIRVRIKNETNVSNLQMYWSTNLKAIGVAGGPALVPISTGDTLYHDYYFAMDGISGWQDNITQLRFDLNGITSGLLYIDEVELVRKEAFVEGSHTWSFNNNPEGFKEAFGLSSWYVEDGKLVANCENTISPSFYSPDMNVQANKISTIRVRISNNTANVNMQIFWKTTDNPSFSETMYVNKVITSSQTVGEYTDYLIDVGSNLAWTSNITGFRIGIQSTQSGESFRIDEIELIAADRIPMPTFWGFNNGVEGWRIAWSLSSLVANSGSLIATSDGGANTSIYSPALEIDTTKYKAIRVRLNNQTIGENLQLYWITKAKPVYGGIDPITIPINKSQQAGQFTDYYFDLSKSADWAEIATEFRLGITSGTNIGEQYLFDEVELLDFVPSSPSYWDFSNGIDIWSIGWNSLSSLTCENGKLKGITSGTGAYIYSPALSISASENKLIRVRVNNKTNSSTLQLFWDGNDNGTNYYMGTAGQPVSVNIAANQSDNTYYDYYFDMSTNAGWAGEITKVRIDFAGTVAGQELYIDEIAFLPISWNFNNGLNGWSPDQGISTIGLINGALAATVNATSGARINSPIMKQTAQDIKYVKVSLRNGTAGKELKLRWISDTNGTYSDTRSISAGMISGQLPRKDGKQLCYDYYFDLSQATNWSGTILGIQLVFPTSAIGDKIFVDEISLHNGELPSTLYEDNNGTIIIDAEKAMQYTEYASTWRWKLIPGEFFYNNPGIKEYNYRAIGGMSVFAGVETSTDPLVFRSKVKAAGTYTLWVRAHGGTTGLVINVNGTDSTNAIGYSSFQWYNAGTFTLAEGDLTLSARTSSGNYIDAFALSTDPTYDPKNIGAIDARDKGNVYMFNGDGNDPFYGLNASFSSSPTGRMSYVWQLTNAATQAVTNLSGITPAYTFETGEFNIKLTVTDLTTGEHSTANSSKLIVKAAPLTDIVHHDMADPLRMMSARFGYLNKSDTTLSYLMEYSGKGLDMFSNNGTKLWGYRTPAAGYPSPASDARDVGGLIWDFDNDDHSEVIHWRYDEVSNTEKLAMVNGTTGAVIRQVDWPMQRGYLNNKLAVAYLAGRDKAPYIVVLSGDTQNNTLAAYDNQLNQRWKITDSRWHDAYGHYPYIRDVDNDGSDEIIISGICYSFNYNAGTGELTVSKNWDIIEISASVEHVECMSFNDIDNDGIDEILMAVGLRGVYCVNSSTGAVKWKKSFDYNIQYINTGKFQAGNTMQVLVSERMYINHYIYDFSYLEGNTNQSRLYLLDGNGNEIWKQESFDAGREKKPIVADYNGDGFDEIMAWNCLVDGTGYSKPVLRNGVGGAKSVDMDGDGIDELVLTTPYDISTYGLDYLNLPTTGTQRIAYLWGTKELQYKYVNHTNYGP